MRHDPKVGDTITYKDIEGKVVKVLLDSVPANVTPITLYEVQFSGSAVFTRREFKFDG